jgi:predicted dinucleotide-utilizing enzyme
MTAVSLPDLFCTTATDALINRPDVDFVIEAASQVTVQTVAEKVPHAGKGLLIMSVGALRDDALTRRLEELAGSKGMKVRARHEVAGGDAFGEFQTFVTSHVHPTNPKTSCLAAFAVIRILRKITEPIQVGT